MSVAGGTRQRRGVDSATATTSSSLEPRRRQRHGRRPGRQRHAAVQRREHRREHRRLRQRRARALSRDVGAVTMDLDGVERIDCRRPGRQRQDQRRRPERHRRRATVDIDLRRRRRQRRRRGRHGRRSTARPTRIAVKAAAAETVVSGLAAEVHVSGADGRLDELAVNGLAGNDTIDASALRRGRDRPRHQCRRGRRQLIGSAGNDAVNGGQGNDSALLGARRRHLRLEPGDASDTVEGQGGSDTLLFNGANIAEKIDIAANGDRVRFTRDIGTVDDGRQWRRDPRRQRPGRHRPHRRARPGRHRRDQVDLDLAAAPGGSGGDGANDVVTVDGTGGDDFIQLSMQDGNLRHRRPRGADRDPELRRRRPDPRARPGRRRRHPAELRAGQRAAADAGRRRRQRRAAGRRRQRPADAAAWATTC